MRQLSSTNPALKPLLAAPDQLESKGSVVSRIFKMQDWTRNQSGLNKQVVDHCEATDKRISEIEAKLGSLENGGFGGEVNAGNSRDTQQMIDAAVEKAVKKLETDLKERLEEFAVKDDAVDESEEENEQASEPEKSQTVQEDGRVLKSQGSTVVKSVARSSRK